MVIHNDKSECLGCCTDMTNECQGDVCAAWKWVWKPENVDKGGESVKQNTRTNYGYGGLAGMPIYPMDEIKLLEQGWVMANKEMVKVGRVAMRQEGGFWLAYYAENETMDKALILGTIKRSIIMKNKKRKKQFMQLMRDIVFHAFVENGGHEPEWGGEEPAPEHERAGHA